MAKANKEAEKKAEEKVEPKVEAPEVDDTPDAPEEVEAYEHTMVQVLAACGEGNQTVVRIETPNADNVEHAMEDGESAVFEVTCDQKLVVLERDVPTSTTYDGAAK